MFSTSVAIIVFNRPEKTRKLMDVIKTVKPKTLLVIADGPRDNRNDDKNLVKLTRNVVEESISWKCDLVKNYSDINLGCKFRVSSGLDWAFRISDKLIILEDDCIPNMSFFKLCEELLHRFQNSSEISSISGSHPFNDGVSLESSYTFTKYNRIWGWASWQRAWAMYDPLMSDWPDFRSSPLLKEWFPSLFEREYWRMIFDKCYSGQIDTWDYQWFYTRLRNGMLTAVSSHNLVQNIGFDSEGTHTNSKKFAGSFSLTELPNLLVHPSIVEVNKERDALQSKFIVKQNWKRLVKWKINTVFKNK